MTIYRSSKGNFEQHEEVEIFTDKYVSNVNGKASYTATGNKYFGAPGNAPVNTITDVVVEFRTKQTGYDGEFGFDWLRIDDGALTTEKAYEACIIGGYEAPNGKAPHRDANTSFESGEAFKALQKEYKQIVIVRKSTTAKKYYVPWLNLFPKSVSDATTVATGMPKPPFEAELRMLIDVEGTDPPDQIRIVFNEKYFTIDGKDGTDANPVLISDKAVGANREAPATIKIRCIDEFNTDQEIKVYAYPKDSLSKPIATQKVLRKLAGKIIVGANKNTPAVGKAPAVNNRKTQKFVFVSILTDINKSGVIAKGNFTVNEKINLQNCLYQSLIQGEFIDKNPSGNDFTVDLSANSDFQIGGKFYDVATSAFNEDYRINSTDVIPHFFKEIRKAFLNMPGNTIYNKHYTVFTLGEAVYDNAAGQVEDIGTKNLILYKNRNDRTLSHEGLHGLGLDHTHDDGTFKPSRKYTYPRGSTGATNATDNYMSYMGAARKTTWHWQWKIIRSKLK
ncbi:hypothetical protein AR687_17175 [Flavobacteriaceae bacterium CRH]|nr:hypothetical protein AR687_17175 [Flavobacteriaceae bacterium CRH]